VLEPGRFLLIVFFLSFKGEEIFKINELLFRFGKGLEKWTCSFCFYLPIVRALWEKQNVQDH